ncbi:MAG: hypothetical protein OSB17_00525 [Ulvibacter sp.]|nr:hypothetical protein [Ulvibacter sp.]CAI8338165.1 MAG: Uncharacterised protein [Flavobacteriaceae bacterium]|tara:strand:- start:89 stop:250 length:162 start_codon:yes stop_codon:yes gene_type:complete
MKLLANLSSTHIMQEMEAICKRIFFIDTGSILPDTALEILSKNKQQIIEVCFD